MSNLDTFASEIIREALVAAADEMFLVCALTSMSPAVYEVLDFGCGITDLDGNVVAQANGVTLFLGTLSFGVRSVIEKFGMDGLSPGDIVATNDPQRAGTHLNDVTIVMPIYHEQTLIGFAANKAHWSEIGGRVPGSWQTDSTDVFQEGLQLPGVKVYAEGEPVRDMMDLIAANCRTPDLTLGDLASQVASVGIAVERVQEIAGKYGRQSLLESMEDTLEYGERMARAALAKMPRGVYFAEDYMDDDGLGSGPIPVKVKVTVTEDSFCADFTGSTSQSRGPANCSRVALESAVRIIFKAITTPDVPANDGNFRPLRVVCPDRTVFTAMRPAPVSVYWETANFATDLVWQAVAAVVPDRVTAGHFLSPCATGMVMVHPDTGDMVIYNDVQGGGWGATPYRDGGSAMVCLADGTSRVVPAEVMETRFPVLIEQFRLDPARAGSGRTRGGKGVIRDYRMLTDGALVTVHCGRSKFPPWGVGGGSEGSLNYAEILYADGSRSERMGKLTSHRLRKDDILRVVSASGGGWGEPESDK